MTAVHSDFRVAQRPARFLLVALHVNKTTDYAIAMEIGRAGGPRFYKCWVCAAASGRSYSRSGAENSASDAERIRFAARPSSHAEPMSSMGVDHRGPRCR